MTPLEDAATLLDRIDDVTSFSQKGSPRVSLFCVSVPVLSEQRMSTPASSSIEGSRVTIACFLASSLAPTAMVTDRTVGMATGIAATSRMSANWRVVRTSSPRTSAIVTMIATKTAAKTMS